MTAQVTIKMTDACNLSCTYCYDEPFRSKKTLSENVVERLPWLFDEISRRDSHFQVVFFGGEPFLAPVELFHSVFKVLERYDVSYYAQTNLYAVNPREYASVLERLDGIGFSLDGPSMAHDMQRRSRNNLPTFSPIMAKYAELRQLYPDLYFGAIATITDECWPLRSEYYDFLKASGVDSFSIIPFFDQKLRAGVSPSKYYDVLRAIFEAWIRDPAPVSINQLDAIVGHFLKGRDGGCMMCHGQDCHRGVNSIDTKGGLCACLRLQGESVGGVFDFASLAEYEAAVDKQRAGSVPEKCNSCEFNRLCNGGCPAEYVQGQWYFCDAAFEFYSLVRSTIRTEFARANQQHLVTLRTGAHRA